MPLGCEKWLPFLAGLGAKSLRIALWTRLSRPAVSISVPDEMPSRPRQQPSDPGKTNLARALKSFAAAD